MKIAWVSPLPPSPSGIGDYSADILPFVARLTETVAFSAETWPSTEDPIEVRSYDELPAAIEDGFIPVYHQGNNQFHASIYDLAWEHPGIVVLHDVVLHHFFLDRADRSGDWSLFGTPLRLQYPAEADDLARLREKGVATDLEKFQFPLSGPLVRRSKGAIVHSSYAHTLATMESPDSNIVVIPHHMGHPPEGFQSTELIRKGLGVDGSFLIGVFGYITVPKQGDVLLYALSEALLKGVDAHLVFVGSDELDGRLMALAESLGLEDRIRFTGYLDRPQFYSSMKAMDIVVALRYPSAGETSGTLSRALALGKCLVVADFASFGSIPSRACVHVPITGPTSSHLAGAIEALERDEELRQRLGEAAHEYAVQELTLEVCARQYVKAADDLARS